MHLHCNRVHVTTMGTAGQTELLYNHISTFYPTPVVYSYHWTYSQEMFREHCWKVSYATRQIQSRLARSTAVCPIIDFQSCTQEFLPDSPKLGVIGHGTACKCTCSHGHKVSKEINFARNELSLTVTHSKSLQLLNTKYVPMLVKPLIHKP